MKKAFYLVDKVESGGAERILIRLANYFSGEYQGYLFPSIVSSGYRNFDLDDLSVIIPKAVKGKSFFSKSINLLKWLLQVFFYARKIKPEISVSFLERSNVVNVIVCKLLKIKSIISVRNNLAQQYVGRNKYEQKLIFIFLKFFYNHADTIVALSEKVKIQLITDFGIDETKIIRIYNPYPIAEFKSKSSEEIESEDIKQFIKNKYSVVTAGRLTKQKGGWHLIRAFAKIKEKNPDAVLLFLGEGELSKALHNLIVELNLEDSVRLFSFQKNPFSIIAKCNVFAFPSLWEGFGNALLEAMSTGIRLVTTDCDFGPREIIGYDIKCEALVSPYRFEFGSLIPKLDGEWRDANDPLTPEETHLAQEITFQLGQSHIAPTKHGAVRAGIFDESVILDVWLEVLIRSKSNRV